LVYEKFGAVIKVLKNGEGEKGKKEKPEYRSIKKSLEIDLEKLKRGEYNLEDLLEKEAKSLGNYDNEEMFLKNGKYGYYVEWGENKQSIRTIKKPVEEIVLKDIIELIKEKDKDGEKDEKSSNILRELTNNLSIRKGKFGAYIYYKKLDMKKPEFFNIKNFKGSFTFSEKKPLIEWINQTYKIDEAIDE
jgi:topoisomerase IA-like protein